VPTFDETFRIKGYLIVGRNQTRDYLDVAALADRRGLSHAARVLAEIDDYYRDQRPLASRGVATQLAHQLADPLPQAVRSTTQLAHYRELDPMWHHWDDAVNVCREVAVLMNVAP
jgi:predicted nucleotidyltransferase component of viral defense system